MIDMNRSRYLAMRPRVGYFRVLLLLPVLIMAGLGSMLAGRVTAQTLTTMPYLFYYGGPYDLLLSEGILYGTAGGGTSGDGMVFGVNADGTGFTNLHNFSPAISNSLGINTNSDGIRTAGLVLTGSTLYGVTVYGGSFGNGTLFKLNKDGTAFTNLYNFSSFNGYFTNAGAGFGTGTNAEGANPSASLTLSADNLYLFGTTENGGMFGQGTMFKVNTDGTGFTILHSFTTSSYGTNSDG